MKSKDSLVKDIGQAVFNTMLARIQAKDITVEYKGRILSEGNPGWLDVACTLVQFFAPVDAWASDMSIVTLMKSSGMHLHKAILFEIEREDRDETYIQNLLILEDVIGQFLLRNELTTLTPEENSSGLMQ